ncbi:unnamed protein product [Closterium sp. NIES-54]
MTFLRSSGESSDGSGGSSGSGGGRSSSRYGAVRWGVSGGGQLHLQRSQYETLSSHQLREWYAHRSGGGGSSGSRCAAVQLGVYGGGLTQLRWHSRETLMPQQLRVWYAQRGASRSSARCPYVICTCDRAGQTCGTVGRTQSRCFSCLSDTWRAEFGDAGELPRWLELHRQGVDIFSLDCDAILTAMYALTIGTEGDSSLCVLPDPGIEAAALGASESTLPGTAPSEALHTFTLDSGASRCFFRDSTTLTPLSAHYCCPPGRDGHYHHSWGSVCVDLHMYTDGPPPGHVLYTLATESPQAAASTQVSALRPVAPTCTCRLLTHQTLLWHHRLGHPSLPRLRGMHSRLLVSGLPRSLPPLPPSPAPPCLPCVEGRQRAAPHSSSFPPTTAPLQILHMDVWGPARICASVSNFASVMEVARTSMIHAAAPHFLWPFAVRYAAHQLNLSPHVSLPETSPTLRWTGEVGDASVFQVWGSRAFFRVLSVDKLSARTIPCVFLGFPPDVPAWQFYHPTSRRVLSSQDVIFDESVPFYRLFPYRSSPPPPPPLFLAPGPPPVDPLPGTVPVEVAVGSGAARSTASGGAATRGVEPGGAESEGAGSGGAEPGDAEHGGAEPASAEPGGAKLEGVESGGAEPRGTASSGVSAAGGTGAGGVGVTAGAGGSRGAAAAGPGGARTRGTGAAGTGTVAGAGNGGAVAGDHAEPGGPGAGGTGASAAGAVGAGAGDTGAVGAGARCTGAGGAGAGGAGAGDTGTVDPGAGGAGAGGAVSGGTGAGGTVRPRP